MTKLQFLKSLAIVGLLLFLGVAPHAFGQRERREGPYRAGRSLVGRVQSDLQRCERFRRAQGKERERYDNAIDHLSRFDQELSAGRFDKDMLDRVIDNLKNVVDGNTLTPRERDILNVDLRDLRSLRANRATAY